MGINNKKLKLALQNGIITEEIYNNLIEFSNRKPEKKQSEQEAQEKVEVLDIFKNGFKKNIFYAFFLLIIAGMSILMFDIVDRTNYITILLLSLVYGLIFWFSGEFLWKRNHKILSGICYISTILVIGLITADITKMTGLYPHFSKPSTLNYLFLSKLSLTLISAVSLGFAIYFHKIRQNFLSIIPVIGGIFAIFSPFVVNVASLFTHFVDVGFSNAVYWGAFAVALIILGKVYDTKLKYDYSFWFYTIGAILLYFSTQYICLISLALDRTAIVFGYAMLLLFSFFYLVLNFVFKRKVFLIIGYLGSIIYSLSIEAFVFDRIFGFAKIPLYVMLAITFCIVVYLSVIIFTKFKKLKFQK